MSICSLVYGRNESALLTSHLLHPSAATPRTTHSRCVIKFGNHKKGNRFRNYPLFLVIFDVWIATPPAAARKDEEVCCAIHVNCNRCYSFSLLLFTFYLYKVAGGEVSGRYLAQLRFLLGA